MGCPSCRADAFAITRAGYYNRFMLLNLLLAVSCLAAESDDLAAQVRELAKRNPGLPVMGKGKDAQDIHNAAVIAGMVCSTKPPGEKEKCLEREKVRQKELIDYSKNPDRNKSCTAEGEEVGRTQEAVKSCEEGGCRTKEEADRARALAADARAKYKSCQETVFKAMMPAGVVCTSKPPGEKEKCIEREKTGQKELIDDSGSTVHKGPCSAYGEELERTENAVKICEEGGCLTKVEADRVRAIAADARVKYKKCREAEFSAPSPAAK